MTKEEVSEAATDDRSGEVMMTLLLDRRGADVQITEEVVALIAARFGQEVMAMLLDRRGADVQITEEVVKTGRAKCREREEMMVIVDRRGDERKKGKEGMRA